MNKINLNNVREIIPGNEPVTRPPKFFKDNQSYEYPDAYGRSIDKITLLHPQSDVVKKRFTDLKNCKSISTFFPNGQFAYLHIHAEHMHPFEAMYKPVHGAVISLLNKGCYRTHVTGDESYYRVAPEASVPILERLNMQILIDVLSHAKLHEVEIAYDVYEYDINFEELRNCPKMNEKYAGETFYSRDGWRDSGDRDRVKNKPILAIYDRTKALVDKGKLPLAALDSTHVWRVELRMTSRYIERQIDPKRSVYVQESGKFIPDFLRLCPTQAVDALASFSRRTINRYVSIEEVWEDLNPEAELYTLLFETVGRTDSLAPESILQSS